MKYSNDVLKRGINALSNAGFIVTSFYFPEAYNQWYAARQEAKS